MSVINKALQELNKRKTNQQYGKYTPSDVSNSAFGLTKMLIIVVILSFVFLGSVICYKFVYQNNNQKNNVVTDVTSKKNLKETAIKNNLSTDNQIENNEVNTVNELSSNVVEDNSLNTKHSNKESNIVVDTNNSTTTNNEKIENKLEEDSNSLKKLDDKKNTHNDFNSAQNEFLEENESSTVENEYIYEEVKPKPQMKVEYKKLTKQEELEILNKKANQAIATGNKNAAIKAYKDMLSIDQFNTNARKSLSSIYYGIGNNLEAIKCLSKGIELQPNHYDYRLYLARIYHSLNQNEQAIKVLKKSNPPVNGNVDYYATMANYSRDIGDYQTAEYAYRRLSNSQKDGKWYLGLAIVLEQQNKKSEALQAYKATEGLFLSNSSRKYVMQRIKVLESTKK